MVAGSNPAVPTNPLSADTIRIIRAVRHEGNAPGALAGPEALPVLLDEAAALAILRHPYSTAEHVHAVASRRNLVSSYAVRKAIALHQRAAHHDASRLLPHLRWHDLLVGSLNLRVPPLVRRSCERLLLERLPELAIGERCTLARTAPRGVLSELRFDPHPLVFAAVLSNPRLVEDDVVSLVGGGRCSRESLATVARDAKWSARYPVRLALLRNPASPPEAVVAFVTSLRKGDLAAVLRHPSTGTLVRLAAERTLDARAERRGAG